jgi:hypothetical protein
MTRSYSHIFCYDARMKILTAVLLMSLFAGCASYHDGNKKGIFLKNEAPVPVDSPTSALIEFESGVVGFRQTKATSM